MLRTILLWLPYVAAEYVRVRETPRSSTTCAVPHVHRCSRPASWNRTTAWRRSGGRDALRPLSFARIDKGLTAGAHGLPLFGTGDWNDGMNNVGMAGRGESVWLGFFIHSVLTAFAPLCEARGNPQGAQAYKAAARSLTSKLELAWDGEWYRRGYYDDGSPLGSAQNDECAIDSIAQSWAVCRARSRNASPNARWMR